MSFILRTLQKVLSLRKLLAIQLSRKKVRPHILMRLKTVKGKIVRRALALLGGEKDLTTERLCAIEDTANISTAS